MGDRFITLLSAVNRFYLDSSFLQRQATPVSSVEAAFVWHSSGIWRRAYYHVETSVILRHRGLIGTDEAAFAFGEKRFY
jgi:hypothetical protein